MSEMAYDEEPMNYYTHAQDKCYREELIVRMTEALLAGNYNCSAAELVNEAEVYADLLLEKFDK